MEIQIWEAQADDYDVQHIINGDVTASSLGVPLGVFENDKVAQILKTIVDFKIERSARRWSKAAQIGVWLALIATGIFAVIKWLIPTPPN